MSDVQHGPEKDQVSIPPSVHPEFRGPWRMEDPGDVRRWLRAMREHVKDAVAAGEDATRKLKKRFFSRHEARRRIKEAEVAILGLLDVAERQSFVSREGG